MKSQREVKQFNKSRSAAFSMIEILIVIGIIGVLVAAGSVGYMQQLNQSRVDSAVSVISAKMQQARQMAIAMRQVRRVAFDVGAFVGNGAVKNRSRRATITIEGKRCQEFAFSDNAFCVNPTSSRGANTGPNAIEYGDADYLPENVAIADIDGRIPGENNLPEIFYIEFTPRGAVGKVYFQGEEKSTNYNEIAPIIHLIRDNEVFTWNDKSGTYADILNDAGSSRFLFDGGEDAKERYKVQTVEVVRLTGKVRSYNFAIMNPWPLDEPDPSNY